MPTVIGHDLFNGTDGQAITAHTADSGQGWSYHPTNVNGILLITTDPVDSGAVRLSAANSSLALATLDLTPASGDYDVEARFWMSSDDNSNFGVVGRCDPTAATYYTARYNTNGNAYQLYRLLNGTALQLGTDQVVTLTTNVPHTLTLQMRGTTISLLVDGTPLISVTNADIPGPGRPGLRGLGAAGAGGIHIGEFTVTLADGTTAPDTGDRHFPRGIGRGILRGVF